MKPDKPIVYNEFYLDVMTGGSSELPAPVTPEQHYLAHLAGMTVTLPQPIILRDMFLAKICGMDVDVPTYIPGKFPRKFAYYAKAAGQDADVPQPITREEKYWFDYVSTPSEKEYTGAVPVTFTANGQPLLDYLISGNTVQSGTPTPDSPVMPQGTGERTGNLCPDTGWRSGQYRDGVWETTNTRSTSDFFPVSSNQYRLKINAGQLISFINFNYFDNQKQWLGNRTTLGMPTFSPTAQNIVIPQLPSNAAYMSITIRFYNDNGNPPIPQSFIDDSNIMVSEGTSEPSYEPYGIKIPISSASTTTPIYLGEVPTTRKIKKLVFTGEEQLWFYDSDYTCFGISILDMYVYNTRLSTVICSHYPCIDDGRAISDIPNNTVYVTKSTPNRFFVKTDNYTTAADFKAYLAQQYAAGTPVTVWYVLATEETGIVNEPLMRIGDYADTLSMEQAGVEIPTARGTNTLDVLTDVKPSEIYIKYKE